MENKKDALIVLCSRPESSRVREKCFRKLAGHDSIEHILRRVEGAGVPVCLAVPTKDVPRYEKYVSPNVYVFGGNAESPLHRMDEASRYANSSGLGHKYVVRITHDDPLIDKETMLDSLEAVKQSGAGYGISPGLVDGAGVEIISTGNLHKAAEKRKEPTEFVSYFVRGDVVPNSKISRFEPRQNVRRSYRLTMDYEEDFTVLNMILSHVGPFAPLDKVVSFCDANPSIFNYNRLPVWSVYTCVHNAESFIFNCADSVLNASDGLNMEYIIVDDGSTDKSLVKLAPFFSDKRIKIVQNGKNIGLASSSNVAINKARGKYVMRVDADDVLLHDSIVKMTDKMDETSAAAVYSGFYKVSDKTERIEETVFDPRENTHAGCALMNKSILNEIRYRDGLRHWDSLDLYNRLNAFGVAYIDEPLWMYRRHDKNMSANNLEEREKIRGQIDSGEL